MSADWLDCFLGALQELAGQLMITALALECARGGTFEPCHIHRGGGHILATVTHHLEILGLPCKLVATLVSCWMENGDQTAERQEETAVQECNCTILADDSDWCVYHISGHCLWQFLINYLMILNCCHGILWAREATWWTLIWCLQWRSLCWHTLWRQIVINYSGWKMWCIMNESMVEYIAGSSDLRWNEWLLISYSVVTNCAVSLHLGSMNSIRLRETNLNHIYPAFLCYILEFVYWDTG